MPENNIRGDIPISHIAQELDSFLYNEMLARKTRLNNLQEKTHLRGVPQVGNIKDALKQCKALMSTFLVDINEYLDTFLRYAMPSQNLATYGVGIVALLSLGLLLVNKTRSWVDETHSFDV